MRNNDDNKQRGMDMKYFKSIEKEINGMINSLALNMVNAVNDEEWEVVLLTAGAIMDNVKTLYPTAAGNLHRIMSGKFNGDRDNSSELFS
tara:strand:+ start:307 stop:576 length:270 start_codon:yes stop_codon:yes gene_type:complete